MGDNKSECTRLNLHQKHLTICGRSENSEQKGVLVGIETQLRQEPTVETRNRKKLRPNDVAEWELRIGRFRVLYNIEKDVRIVSIEAIGFKIGNQLFIHGEKTEL